MVRAGSVSGAQKTRWLNPESEVENLVVQYPKPSCIASIILTLTHRTPDVHENEFTFQQLEFSRYLSSFAVDFNRPRTDHPLSLQILLKEASCHVL